MAPVGFEQYLARRGYDLRGGARPFLRRMFVESLGQPGFHRFWRVWNPLYGFALYRLYVALGGNRRRVRATLAVFVLCGALLHDLPVSLLLGRVSLATTCAFSLFAVLALASRAAQPRLRQRRWPPLANAAVNVAALAGGLGGGAWLSRAVAG